MKGAEPVSSEEFARLFAGAQRFSTLVLAVSGGPDSMALMHLAARSLGKPRGAIVATVDHGLRLQSAHEAQSVRDAAAALGFPHETLVWPGVKPASGLQAAARRARYGLLAALARRSPQPAAIVTAHTRDDQAETMLMRLARGSGVDGLSAMSEDGDIEGVVLLRPLLGISKQRLAATLKDLGGRWIEDPSNDLEQFERVRVRRARPARDELGLSDEALALSAGRLRRARTALEAATNDFLVSFCRDMSLLAFGAAEWLVGSPQASAEIEIRALRRLLAAIGGLGEPTSLSKVEALHADLSRPGFSGATLARCLLQPRGARLSGAKGEPEPNVLITRETAREPLPVLTLEPGQTQRWDGRFDVGLAPGFLQPATVRAVDRETLEIFDAFASPKRRVRRTHLPATVVYALPAFWRDDELLGIPSLAEETEPRQPSPFSARFAALPLE